MKPSVGDSLPGKFWGWTSLWGTCQVLVLVPVRRSGLHRLAQGNQVLGLESTSRSPAWEGEAMENTWRSRELLGLFLPLDADALKNIWTWRGRIPLWWPQPWITSAVPVHEKATGKQTAVCTYVCPHCGNYSDTHIRPLDVLELMDALVNFFFFRHPHPSVSFCTVSMALTSI